MSYYPEGSLNECADALAMEHGAIAWRTYTRDKKAFVELRFDDANDTKILFQVGDEYVVNLDNKITWNRFPNAVLIEKVAND